MKYSPETQMLQPSKDQFGATQFPVYLSSAFAFENPEDIEKVFTGQKFGYVYGRIQNPSLMNLERRIASMSNLPSSLLTTTGMAALSGIILTLLSSGDAIISHRAIFGGTLALFENVIKKLGIDIVYADFHKTEEIEKGIGLACKNGYQPALVFCETMGNPALDLHDINAIGAVAKKHDLPLILDATLTPPGFIDLSKAEVAIEMHSSTKFICGNGTVLGGVLFDRGGFDWSKSTDTFLRKSCDRFGRENAFLSAFRFQALQNLGMTAQPFSATVTGLGLETMGLRVARQFENALALAEFLSEKGVQVHYPGLPSSPYYTNAKRYMNKGSGSLLTINFGTKERAYAFARSLKLTRIMTNFGDLRTIAIHTDSTIFRDSSEEVKRLAGSLPGLLRISLGLENIEDIKSDFAQALEAL